jgi:hypothetical protein
MCLSNLFLLDICAFVYGRDSPKLVGAGKAVAYLNSIQSHPYCLLSFLFTSEQSISDKRSSFLIQSYKLLL